MNDKDRPERRNGDDDSDIRALMRESDYSIRMSDEFKRNLLRELNHNFDYHPVHTRLLVAVAVVLCVGTALWMVTDVGSDGFDLRPSGRVVQEAPVVEAPLTGTRFNAPAVGGSRDEGVAVARDIYEQIAADAAKVLSLETWTIGGATVHFVRLEVVRDGVPAEVVRSIGDSKQFERRWRAVQSAIGSEALDAIRRGDSDPPRTELTRVLSRELPMGVWTWELKEYGTVVYKRSLR